MRASTVLILFLVVPLNGCQFSLRAGASTGGAPSSVPSEASPTPAAGSSSVAYAAPASAPPQPPPTVVAPPAAAPPPVPILGLPVIGSSPRVSGNRHRLVLVAGIYRGELVVSGNSLEMLGAGAGQTVIEGGLRVSGNHNLVQGLTVRGPTQVSGNGNRLAAVEYQGAVRATGNNNQY